MRLQVRAHRVLGVIRSSEVGRGASRRDGNAVDDRQGTAILAPRGMRASAGENRCAGRLRRISPSQPTAGVPQTGFTTNKAAVGSGRRSRSRVGTRNCANDLRRVTIHTVALQV
ncbi:hypothetical protein ACSBPU_19110 [Parapusillimonas sp. JC17]|uniref:hypothetical protein n=1 Tax=Parapusillimonas sp. JC17 TaxID=3445768 RepID=UPI003FA14073